MVADGAPVLMWLSGADGRCTYVNQPWLEFTGRTLEQELGEGWAGGIHPADRERCLATYGAAFAARREFELEYQRRRHDGEYRRILDRGKPILGADGRFAGYIGACVDLTHQLRIAASRRPRLTGANQQAIVWLTPEGRVATWTPGAEQLTGHRADEIIGQDFSAFYAPEDVRQGKPEHLLCVAAAEGWVHDVGWQVRKDGSRFWANMVIAALHDEAGRPRGFVKVTRDITQRQRTDAKLRQQAAFLTRLRQEQRELVERLAHVRGRLEAQERERLLEDERRRLARDLHDQAEQTLFAVGLTAQQALMQLPAERRHDPSAALGRLVELAQDGAERVREASFALNHADVVDRELVSALRKLVQAFQQRTGIEADLVLTGAQQRLPAELAEALHTVAREALANVERHSRGSVVVVGLAFGRRSVTLSVQDDGVGASALVLKRISASTLHFGLRSSRHAVQQLDGSFAARPGPDGGFLIQTRLPLPLTASRARRGGVAGGRAREPAAGG